MITATYVPLVCTLWGDSCKWKFLWSTILTFIVWLKSPRDLTVLCMQCPFPKSPPPHFHNYCGPRFLALLKRNYALEYYTCYKIDHTHICVGMGSLMNCTACECHEVRIEKTCWKRQPGWREQFCMLQISCALPYSIINLCCVDT